MITFKNEYGIKYSVISFDELLKFIDYDFISEINCSNNNLTQLPILPLYLVKLDCSNNKLSSLPEIPKNLGWLYTADNNLSELPVMPLSLRILECSNNKLYKLPELPRKVKYLYCINNNITDLPYLPDQLHYLDFNNNPIKLFIDTYFEGSKTLYLEWKKKNETIFANKLGDWFLECKYNPKYKYCIDRVNDDYDSDVIQIKT
jgi:Leucine-rich repeat (LRR) protein